MKNTFQRNKHIIQSKIGEEIVMLDVESGFYFGLDPVGTFIWEQLEYEISFDVLVNKLMIHFEVDRKVCEDDTRELLSQLIEKKLILCI